MRRKTAAIVMLLAAVCLIFTGCGKSVTADISEYENESITIEGLGDETITLTAADLKEMECVSKTVTTQSKGKEISVDVSGPTLQTLLEQYGVSLEDVTTAVFTASDGYTKQFDSGFFTTHKDIYLSLANGDEPLAENEQPVRLVIAGATSDNWVKGVVKIQFR